MSCFFFTRETGFCTGKGSLRLLLPFLKKFPGNSWRGHSSLTGQGIRRNRIVSWVFFDCSPAKRIIMPTKIKISIKDIIMDAELFDTPCARAIAAALPIEARPNEWGDEFYFQVPVKMSLDETATTKVNIGDIGYWPPADPLAVLFR